MQRIEIRDYKPKGLMVRVEEHEVDVGWFIAQKRIKENEDKPHIYPKRIRLQPQPFAELSSVCCEIAVAKHVNEYWCGLAWKTNLQQKNKTKQDVGQNIEVKRIVKPDNPLRFAQKDLDLNRKMFLAFCLNADPTNINDVWVDLIGYGMTKILAQNAKRDPDGGYIVEQQFLRRLV